MRICLFGAAGSGKSTTAARLFADLRLRDNLLQSWAVNKKVIYELVTEAIKPWAYMKRPCRSYDGVHIFGNQLHSEDFLFQHGVDHIVTDSPMHIQCFYAWHFKAPFWQELVSIANKWELSHPSVNVFLDGSNIPYEAEGRYQTHDEAKQIAGLMQQFLDDHMTVPYHRILTEDYERLLHLVCTTLEKTNGH
jgi:hypothetical protein